MITREDLRELSRLAACVAEWPDECFVMMKPGDRWYERSVGFDCLLGGKYGVKVVDVEYADE